MSAAEELGTVAMIFFLLGMATSFVGGVLAVENGFRWWASVFVGLAFLALCGSLMMMATYWPEVLG